MNRVKHVVAAGFVALSLAIGAGSVSRVSADVPRGGDSLQRGCYSLEQRAQNLVAEYGAEGTTDQRKQEIVHELKQIGSDWNAVGCRSRYGDIAYKLSLPVDPYAEPGNVSDPVWEMKPAESYDDSPSNPHLTGTISDPGTVVAHEKQ